MSLISAVSTVFKNAWTSIDSLFSNLPPGTVTISCDQAGNAKLGGWKVAEVRALIKETNPEVISLMCKDGIKINTFDTAYDKWRYDDGREVENELKGLYGNTQRDQKTIRIRRELSSEEAAATLFHEMGHWKRPEPATREEALQQEIDVRVEEEKFRYAHHMPPAEKEYRTKDGKPNRAFIEKEITASPHYNPVGRQRIGRRYVGDDTTSGWCPP